MPASKSHRSTLLAVLAAAAASLAWTGGAAAQVFEGRAFAAAVAGAHFCDTGPLAAAGGNLNVTAAAIASGALQAGPGAASCVGASGVSQASASLDNVAVAQLLVSICTAAHVASQTSAGCDGVTGSSAITALVFAGVGVVVTGQVNQTVSVVGVGTLVINEQIQTGLSITVNALHLTLASGLDIVLCSSHSKFNCPVGVQQATWGGVKSLYQ